MTRRPALAVFVVVGLLLPFLVSGFTVPDLGDEGAVSDRRAEYEASLAAAITGGKSESRVHRSLYMDPAYVPYIHPRLVYEEEIPQQDLNMAAAVANKRAAKGMLGSRFQDSSSKGIPFFMVDVVDFVTKGSGSRTQRVGQDMRNNGKK